jgi:formamidopyrimidine-DNA glycosylase
MPELPEAERARQQIERVLGRTIVAVDDRDMYVCRPHAPGEIEQALSGRRLTRAHRRGKFLWVETDGGPDLGLHLGMAGHILIDSPPAPNNWDRFSIAFEDGGRMALRDKRRLGRAILEPDFDHVGPDAAEVSTKLFRERVRRGTAPLKARLLDQRTVSGIGNLLADEVLWRAMLSPARPAGELTDSEVGRLHKAVRAAVADAVRLGGVHNGEIIPFRNASAHCPRCRTGMVKGRFGGRTTWWCPSCQPNAQLET